VVFGERLAKSFAAQTTTWKGQFTMIKALKAFPADESGATAINTSLK
jgi:hypothetical protein